MREEVDPIISLNFDDLRLAGVQIELDPDEAEEFGAFEETALSEADAWESNINLQGDYSYGF